MVEARDKRDQARRLLPDHTDPGVVKQATKHATKSAGENSFEMIAKEEMTGHGFRSVASTILNEQG